MDPRSGMRGMMSLFMRPVSVSTVSSCTPEAPPRSELSRMTMVARTHDSGMQVVASGWSSGMASRSECVLASPLLVPLGVECWFWEFGTGCKMPQCLLRIRARCRASTTARTTRVSALPPKPVLTPYMTWPREMLLMTSSADAGIPARAVASILSLGSVDLYRWVG